MPVYLALLLLDGANPDTGDWGPDTSPYIILIVAALVIAAAALLFFAIRKNRRKAAKAADASEGKE